jgi:ankyrin repeat protein
MFVRHRVLHRSSYMLAAMSLFTGVSFTPLEARRQAIPQFNPEAIAVLNAAQSGSWNALNKLLPPCSPLLQSRADSGMTLLQWALEQDKETAFRLLLKAGADPEQPGMFGYTVIHDAARHRDSKWLRILLDNAASPDVRNAETGTLPLYEALIANRDAQFAMLVAAKANLKLTDSVGNTPLHIAGLLNKPWHAHYLLLAGAPPMARNAQRQTFQRYLFMTRDALLNQAAREGRQNIIKYMHSKKIPIESNVTSQKVEGQ